MTTREAAIVSAYTGYLLSDFANMQRYAEEVMGRPVWTHEFASTEFVDKLREKSKADFVNISVEDEDYPMTSNTDVPEPVTLRPDPKDIDLVLTCGACPEQYDAFYRRARVGYLRLRHGYFDVVCPDVGGESVYEATPQGDGMFESEERETYLQFAREAISRWVARTGITPEILT